MLIVGGLGAAILFLVCLISAQPAVIVVPLALIVAAAVGWAVRYCAVHPAWLFCPLVMVELITGAWFLSGPLRAVFHYGLITLFCLPLLPTAWRERTFMRGGFGLYSLYFMWAAITVTYSLAPAFSAGRLLNAVMVFAVVSVIVSRVNHRDDVPAMLTALLLGCGVIVVVVALSAVVLPRSITWVVPTDSSDDVVRFSSIFNGPNDVGGLMLVTVGCAAALWPSAGRRRRWLLGALIAAALGAAALADSRTPFVALAVGATCYLVWRYRWRAAVALLVIALAGSLTRFELKSDGYLGRGDVGTLTGRTEIWDFAIGEIERSPLIGYGYEVGGQIFDSRYFPLWWGPWDEGPHSSLHNGYIDRAIGVGLPVTLLWLFFALRPWYYVLRRPDDQWGLKHVAFFMVIPMLVHNLGEASVGDFIGAIGLGFCLPWALAERARLLFREQDAARRRQNFAQAPPAVAAIGGLLAVFVMIALPLAALAQSAPLGAHFGTLPPHAALPSGAQCAQAVRAAANSWEPRPGNDAANHTVPTVAQLAGFHLAPIKGEFAPVADFARVDGSFTGTTDQILRWGACKWGVDEDVVRAEAVAESHWRQDNAGDRTSDLSLCPPGRGFPGAWNGSTCMQSYGIMQMKFRSFGGWPLSKDSTPFNVDFRLAYQRLCMNGDINYLARQAPAADYPRYPLGSTDQMLWGCMGDWFSGSWTDPGALKYIAEVKEDLAQRPWTRPGF
jgi:O-antigen ligase